EFTLDGRGYILIATDGIWHDTYQADALTAIVRQAHEQTPGDHHTIAATLNQHAHTTGTRDNMTDLLIWVDTTPPAQPDADPRQSFMRTDGNTATPQPRASGGTDAPPGPTVSLHDTLNPLAPERHTLVGKLRRSLGPDGQSPFFFNRFNNFPDPEPGDGSTEATHGPQPPRQEAAPTRPVEPVDDVLRQAGEDAKRDARWWESLTPQQRLDVTHKDPDAVRGMLGLSESVLGEASRHSMNRRMIDLRGRRADLSSAEEHELGNLTLARFDVEDAKQAANIMVPTPQVEVLYFDGADERAIVWVGNRDAATLYWQVADPAATLAELAQNVELARQHFEATSSTDPNVATIVWLGSDTQSGNRDARAESDGRRLARDVVALNAGREARAELGGAPKPENHFIGLGDSASTIEIAAAHSGIVVAPGATASAPPMDTRTAAPRSPDDSVIRVPIRGEHKNRVYLAKFRGEPALYIDKPVAGEITQDVEIPPSRLARREVVFYRLAEIFGFGIVPATELYNDGGEGSRMQYIRGLRHPLAAQEYSWTDRDMITYLDYFAGSVDRTNSNYRTLMIPVDDRAHPLYPGPGEEVLIKDGALVRAVPFDHGYTFGVDERSFTTRLQRYEADSGRKPIDANSFFVADALASNRPPHPWTVQKLLAPDPADVAAMMTEFQLEPSAIDLTLRRIDEVQRNGRKYLRGRHDGVLISGETWLDLSRSNPQRKWLVLRSPATEAPTARRGPTPPKAYPGSMYGDLNTGRTNPDGIEPQPHLPFSKGGPAEGYMAFHTPPGGEPGAGPAPLEVRYVVREDGTAPGQIGEEGERVAPVPDARRWAEATIEHTFSWFDKFDDARVGIDEYVANSLRHTNGEVTLTISEHRENGQRVLRFTVSDDSTYVPQPGDLLDFEATRGRGLAMTAILADNTGVTVHDHGKHMWFEFHHPLATDDAVDRDPAEPPAAPAPIAHEEKGDHARGTHSGVPGEPDSNADTGTPAQAEPSPSQLNPFQIAEAFERKHPGTTMTLVGALSAEQADGFAETFDRLLTAFPIPLAAVEISLTDGKKLSAVAKPAVSNNGVSAGTIHFSIGRAGLKYFSRSHIESLAIRRFAHALIQQGRWRAESFAIDDLRAHFIENGGSSREEDFHSWLREQFEGDVVRNDGGLSQRPALTDSFEKVFSKDPHTTYGHRILHRTLTELALGRYGSSPAAPIRAMAAPILRSIRDSEIDEIKKLPITKISGLDSDDIDPMVVRAIGRRLARYFTALKSLQIDEVTVVPMEPELCLALVRPMAGGGMALELSERYVTNAELTRQTIVDGVANGWFSGPGIGSVAETIDHEMGHILQLFAASVLTPPNRRKDVYTLDWIAVAPELVKHFVGTNLPEDLGEFIGFLQRELSDYSLDADGKPEPAEAFAESLTAWSWQLENDTQRILAEFIIQRAVTADRLLEAAALLRSVTGHILTNDGTDPPDSETSPEANPTARASALGADGQKVMSPPRNVPEAASDVLDVPRRQNDKTSRHPGVMEPPGAPDPSRVTAFNPSGDDSSHAKKKPVDPLVARLLEVMDPQRIRWVRNRLTLEIA
ncbi:ATP-binding protein, partial [Nocardia cyriacigeorgica]|uniref:ATP-binding protein n=1 Tax=Nocardia cyriacigeorgica TaxID=135487 RepID=UPI002455BD9B